MFKVLVVFFILNFYSPTYSFTKEKIISQMQRTNNLSFNFIQTIDGKKDNGTCIIKYPKKIIVSNGKSLVIKNRNSKTYYLYPLRKTPLELLLDKKYLISKISILKSREINNEYINFNISENYNKINIFFDKKNFSLIGWQTEDIYQNLVVTFISSVKINQKIDDKIFILPTNN